MTVNVKIRSLPVGLTADKRIGAEAGRRSLISPIPLGQGIVQVILRVLLGGYVYISSCPMMGHEAYASGVLFR